MWRWRGQPRRQHFRHGRLGCPGAAADDFAFSDAFAHPRADPDTDAFTHAGATARRGLKTEQRD